MTDANVQLIRDLYEAFLHRDIPGIFGAFAPAIEIVQSSQLPWGGVYRGHDGARKFFTTLTGHITSTVTIDRYVSAGDHVVAIGWTRGTVNATGAAYDVPIAHVWTVHDGTISRVEFYIDVPTMLAALAKPGG